jgi:Protein of unknown function (DUF3500)/Bacterial Ig-like domain (group 1)
MNRRSIRSTRSLAVVALALVASLAACGGDGTTGASANTPAVVAATAGTGQTLVAGTAATTPFTVQVVNADGTAVSGVVVTWTVTAGGGSLSATTSTTDANGNATTTYTAGSAAGTATVTATVAGLTAVTFTATITSGSTGSVSDSTQAKVLAAVDAFKATLSATQLATFQIAFTQTTASKWSNYPTFFAARNGLRLADLSAAQQTLALAVAQAAMSDSGYNRFNGIRQADNYLATIEPNNFGSSLYFFAVLGTPSATSRWMLQFGGHHFAYNLSFNSAATTTAPTTPTPYHTGAEPQSFTLSGANYAPLQARKVAFYAMINSLDATQKAAAQLTQTFDDMLLGPGKDWLFPTQQGVPGSQLTAAQLALVKTAVDQWLNDVPAPVAATLRADYEADSSLAKTYVAWSKTTDSTVAGSYIRIDGPRVWMEHVIQGGTTIKTQVHIHSVWRDKVRDYGGTISTASVEAAAFARELAEARFHFAPSVTSPGAWLAGE